MTSTSRRPSGSIDVSVEPFASSRRHQIKRFSFEEHGAATELMRAYKDAHQSGTLTMRTTLVFSPNWKVAGGAPKIELKKFCKRERKHTVHKLKRK
jgi:hypothetical protein